LEGDSAMSGYQERAREARKVCRRRRDLRVVPVLGVGNQSCMDSNQRTITKSARGSGERAQINAAEENCAEFAGRRVSDEIRFVERVASAYGCVVFLSARYANILNTTALPTRMTIFDQSGMTSKLN
jgi:hypothetical protein